MELIPTEVFKTYWSFAAERQSVYFNRLKFRLGPWTKDGILNQYRFTNSYRAADRVSQYLISEIQYHPTRSKRPEEVFFRTILFKIFNKIDTWEAIEAANKRPINLQNVDYDLIAKTLSGIMDRGIPVYSAAYIMPSPKFGHKRKFENHLALIKTMLEDSLPDRLRQRPTLGDVYKMLLSYPGLGPFLAFQYTIDLNYSEMLDFDENDFVVAGPGAIDGISKCFHNYRDFKPENIIHHVTQNQDKYLKDYGVDFRTLFGRKLKPIDCQNLFCEISKYSRVAHPEISGISGRTRIKQTYKPASKQLSKPYFPERWGLNANVDDFMAEQLLTDSLKMHS
ncbi:MAG: nucleotide kinase domain-containing protein [Litorimonas sp.]